MTHTPISRRSFLKSSSALATVGILPGILVARDSGAAIKPTTLVSIHLAGGNDSLNTIVPYTDTEYYRVRGPLAISKSDMRPLDERIGLNPGMSGFASLFRRKKMCIIHGVGYPTFNYSHFEATKIYTTGDPTRTSKTGWLGGALDIAVTEQIAIGGHASELTGASIGGVQSVFNGAHFITPILPEDPEAYAVLARSDNQRQALASIIAQPAVATATPVFNTISKGGQSALKTVAVVAKASDLTTSVAYPDTAFAARLRFTAELLRSDDTIRVIAMAQGNYDTHENQRSRQEGQLTELSAGVTAFMDDLYTHGLSGRVVVLLWSEFSRRITPNGNGGTDHGSAQALMLLGDGIRSGSLNDPPNLDDPDHTDRKNLKMRMDFRQVYATLLDGWLDLDSKTILGKSFAPLPILL